MERQVGIATDTSSDLSQSLAERFGIATAPIAVRLDGEEVLTRLDMDRKAFFDKLDSRKLMGTAAVNPHDWLQAYQSLAPASSEIVAITLSPVLSRTFQSAKTAQSLLSECSVRVVDSGTVFAGLALLVLGAAEKAHRGDSAEAIVTWLENARDQTVTGMISPSMAMLARIGRVDGTEGVGEDYALIQVLEGKLAPWGTASSFPEAVEITLKEWATRPGLKYERAVVDHGRVPQLAEALIDGILRHWPDCQVTRIDDGPMTAVVADGAGGVAFALGPNA